jgi:Domain of unknown function (DUF6457)
VSGAVFWVGGGLLLTVLGLKAETSGDPNEMSRSRAAWVGEKLFAPEAPQPDPRDLDDARPDGAALHQTHAATLPSRDNRIRSRGHPDGKETEVATTRADLIDALAERIGTSPLTPSEIEACLALASVAAHGTGDRTAAPLASFLAGIAAARSDDRGATLDDVRRQVAELAPVREAD